MSFDNPEVIMKSLTRMNQLLGNMNPLLNTLNDNINKSLRASTKVIGMMSQTRGMQLGFVADLELLGGAFGRVKRTLSNMFTPLQNTDKGLTRFQKTFSSWGNMWDGAIKGTWKFGKGLRESSKQRKKVNAIEESAASMADIRTYALSKEISLQGRLAGKPPGWQEISTLYEGKKPPDFGQIWGEIMNFPHWEKQTRDIATSVGRKRYPKTITENKLIGTVHRKRFPQEFTPAPNPDSVTRPNSKIHISYNSPAASNASVTCFLSTTPASTNKRYT